MFSPGCHKLSPHPRAAHKTSNTMEDRDITRYACRIEAAKHVLLLLVCSPFTLSALLAGSPPGGTWPESVAVLCLVSQWPPLPCSSTMHEIINSCSVMLQHPSMENIRLNKSRQLRLLKVRWRLLKARRKAYWNCLRGIASLVVSTSDPVTPIYRYWCINMCIEEGGGGPLRERKKQQISFSMGVLSTWMCDEYSNLSPISHTLSDVPF